MPPAPFCAYAMVMLKIDVFPPQVVGTLISSDPMPSVMGPYEWVEIRDLRRQAPIYAAAERQIVQHLEQDPRRSWFLRLRNARVPR